VTLDTVIQFVMQVGVPSTICLYLVWQSVKREERMSARLDALEQFNNVELVKLVQKSTDEHTNSRNTLAELIGAVRSLLDEMRRRPCQLPSEQTTP